MLPCDIGSWRQETGHQMDAMSLVSYLAVSSILIISYLNILTNEADLGIKVQCLWSNIGLRALEPTSISVILSQVLVIPLGLITLNYQTTGFKYLPRFLQTFSSCIWNVLLSFHRNQIWYCIVKRKWYSKIQELLSTLAAIIHHTNEVQKV